MSKARRNRRNSTSFSVVRNQQLAGVISCEMFDRIPPVNRGRLPYSLIGIETYPSIEGITLDRKTGFVFLNGKLITSATQLPGAIVVCLCSTSHRWSNVVRYHDDSELPALIQGNGVLPFYKVEWNGLYLRLFVGNSWRKEFLQMSSSSFNTNFMMLETWRHSNRELEYFWTVGRPEKEPRFQHISKWYPLLESRG